MSEQVLIDRYLSFYYYFQSYEEFSDYLGVSVAEAKQMVRLGKRYHEKRLQEATA